MGPWAALRLRALVGMFSTVDMYMGQKLQQRSLTQIALTGANVFEARKALLGEVEFYVTTRACSHFAIITKPKEASLIKGHMSAKSFPALIVSFIA